MTTDDFISSEEAAQILGITMRAVQGLCQRGTLQARKVSGVYVISRDSVAEYRVRKAAAEQRRAAGGH